MFWHTTCFARSCLNTNKTLADNSLKKMDKQSFSCRFYRSMPTILHYNPQLIHFCEKISDIMGENAILSIFTC